MYDFQSLVSSANSLISVADGRANFVTNWLIVGSVLSVVAAILLFFLFVNKKGAVKGFWGKVKDFLSFKDMYIESLLKMFYIGSTVYIIFTAVASAVYADFQSFFFELLLGPIVIRLAYEFAMVFVKMWKNSEK
ncbi:hypothetical protein IKG28_00955 [Candidatus Saccharibacteria bacterium]|nr:hypothetical protein [Candidatus Saccharibacteria bacterium]MBR3332184.1 hypothetical protein [Candidatus Saccharibacteria bacterium]